MFSLLLKDLISDFYLTSLQLVLPEMFTSKVQFGYPCQRGRGQAVQVGLSCPPPPPPTQDLGQTVSSVNSYCTIMLEYLIVKNINIILVKLTCFYPTFSLVTLVRGLGGKLSRIILEYLVIWDINIISVKLKCLHRMFTLVILVQGKWCKLSRLVYLAPRPGFGSGSVVSQFLSLSWNI